MHTMKNLIIMSKKQLAENAREDADILLKQLDKMRELAKEIMKRFDELPLDDIRIDNT